MTVKKINLAWTKSLLSSSFEIFLNDRMLKVQPHIKETELNKYGTHFDTRLTVLHNVAVNLRKMFPHSHHVTFRVYWSDVQTYLQRLRSVVFIAYKSKHVRNTARSDDSPAVMQKLKVLWDVTSCRLLHIYRRFEGSHCLHIHVQAVQEEYDLGPLDPEHTGNISLRNVDSYLPMYIT